MRLVPLVFAAMLAAGPAVAQSSDASQAAPPGDVSSSDGPELNLPISIDRIRQTLQELPAPPRLVLDRKPDFKVIVEERQRLEELFRALEYKVGPTVPGGLYAYEQQRLLFNKTNHPLEQPYAAYSGGELVTLAIEGLIAKYVAGKVGSGVSGWDRSRAEKAAREEVAQAIAEFCAAQPDRRTMELCWAGTGNR